MIGFSLRLIGDHFGKENSIKWQRGGFECLVRSESFDFQLPIGLGNFCFSWTGTGTHLTQSTTKVTPFKQ